MIKPNSKEGASMKVSALLWARDYERHPSHGPSVEVGDELFFFVGESIEDEGGGFDLWGAHARMGRSVQGCQAAAARRSEAISS
jgi:hypothetical protein